MIYVILYKWWITSPLSLLHVHTPHHSTYPLGLLAQLTRSAPHPTHHLQYAATQPLFDMLLAAYPQFLQPEWFDYDGYLWAAELWYSYAFEVSE